MSQWLATMQTQRRDNLIKLSAQTLFSFQCNAKALGGVVEDIYLSVD